MIFFLTFIETSSYEEAQPGSSKADFTNKVSIALKEMRESNYWIRILIATSGSNEKLLEQLVHLKNESEELKEILGKIVVSSREAKH